MLLDGETTNQSAQIPVPIQSYTDTTSMGGPDVTIIAQNLQFTPSDVTIDVGQTVRWMNVETMSDHNVNGKQSVYPCNPVGFYSGDPANGPWQFDVTFAVPGVYNYQCDTHVSFGMVGTITVVDPLAPAYPTYAISTVLAEDASGVADSIGTLCTLQGIVHGPNFRPQGLQFTMIDVGAGVGINVFKSGADCYQVTEGDMISVKGSIAQFNGLTEITPDGQIQVVSTGNTLMVPQEVTGALNESMESTMAMVRNLTVDSIVSTGTAGWNLFGTNPLSVGYLIRFDSDVFTDVSQYEGHVIDVVGIVTQFDAQSPYLEGYQLQPRAPQDVSIQVSTKDLLPASAVTIQPNPFSERIWLNTDQEVKSVRLCSLTGRVIREWSDQVKMLEITGVPAGAYLLIVQTAEGRWSGRLIKQ